MSSEILKLKAGSETRSVLIIDDDRELAESLRRILHLFFKECVIAQDGEEAFERFRERYEKNSPFSVVITDLELPKMGGLRLIRQIRSLSKHQPILILSAHDEAEYMAEAIRLDVSGYLLKPLAMPKLFEGLEKIFASIEGEHTVGSVDTDPITGWKSFHELANRIQTLEFLPITLIRMRVNHLFNIFTFVGELYANDYIRELSALIHNLLSDLEGELYRTGNDEFCFVLDNDQRELAGNIASNLISMVRYFHTSEKGIILNSTLSVGIAYGKEHVLLHSKLALEKVEDTIRGGYRVYRSSDADENTAMSESRNILRMIFQALQEENIVPFFQPIRAIGTSELFAYESTAKIRNGDELYGAETFWSLAIDMGQMGMITRSLIRHSFELFSTLNPSKPIVITLSEYDLSDESLLSYILFWKERYAIQPANIFFQIAGGVKTLHQPSLLSAVQSLQKAGFKIILNDFGIGECNLSVMLSLRPDFVKLHHDLITKPEKDSSFDSIVSKMVEIIHILGAQAIASPITQSEQLPWLQKIGIDYLQSSSDSELFEVKHD